MKHHCAHVTPCHLICIYQRHWDVSLRNQGYEWWTHFCVLYIWIIVLQWSWVLCGYSIDPGHITTLFQQYSGLLFFILVKFRCGVIIWRILYYGAVLRSSTLMNNILLSTGWRVLEFMEIFLSVALHWYVYMFMFVIKLDGEWIIQFTFPINYDFV